MGLLFCSRAICKNTTRAYTRAYFLEKEPPWRAPFDDRRTFFRDLFSRRPLPLLFLVRCGRRGLHFPLLRPSWSRTCPTRGSPKSLREPKCINSYDETNEFVRPPFRNNGLQGSPLGPPVPPRRPPKGPPRDPEGPPGGAQGHPKEPQRAHSRPPRRPKESPRATKAPQGSLKPPPGPPRVPPRTPEAPRVSPRAPPNHQSRHPRAPRSIQKVQKM